MTRMMIWKHGTIYLVILISFAVADAQILLPVKTANRTSVKDLKLTPIGKFGLMRKPRKTVPAHLHTGIDIQRPSKNYLNEPIFPIAPGQVISMRDDGPYALIILEHLIEDKKIWSCYEHIAGIKVKTGDEVHPQKAIARFMNKEELDTFGWQFDHFHLEILKVKPIGIPASASNPGRRYNSYTLLCDSGDKLDHYFYNPSAFLKAYLSAP